MNLVNFITLHRHTEHPPVIPPHSQPVQPAIIRAGPYLPGRATHSIATRYSRFEPISTLSWLVNLIIWKRPQNQTPGNVQPAANPSTPNYPAAGIVDVHLMALPILTSNPPCAARKTMEEHAGPAAISFVDYLNRHAPSAARCLIVTQQIRHLSLTTTRSQTSNVRLEHGHTPDLS